MDGVVYVLLKVLREVVGGGTDQNVEIAPEHVVEQFLLLRVRFVAVHADRLEAALVELGSQIFYLLLAVAEDQERGLLFEFVVPQEGS